MASKWIFPFGTGDVKDKDLFGDHGCFLGEMTKLGLPIPPGFTIVTLAQAAVYFYKQGQTTEPTWLDQEISQAVSRLEAKTGKQFGKLGPNGMLLLRLQSKSTTMLYIGLNDASVEILSELTKNELFAWDSYLRLVQWFAEEICHVPCQVLDHHAELRESKRKRSVSDLKRLVGVFQNLALEYGKGGFPQDPFEQLTQIVFRLPTVNCQAIVFGNIGEVSGSGLAFSRNPLTGNTEIHGEYVSNCQDSSDVNCTPESLETMKTRWPRMHAELTQVCAALERHFKAMQEIEFTIERGVLFLLQTRKSKCTAQAAVRMAVDMVKEGLLTKQQALLSMDPNQLGHLFHKRLDPKAKAKALLCTTGMPASPGAAVGKSVFSPEQAVEFHPIPTVLIRTETSPEDIQGMHWSQGVLTQRGGMTSHAAVVARGMGRCCITGCEALQISQDNLSMQIHDLTFHKGDWISLDGSTGQVFQGKLRVIDPELGEDYAEFMSWADSVKSLSVRTNADTPEDAAKAITFGAEGIGLVRTEHMFFAESRLALMRCMILSHTKEARLRYLAKLLPFQQGDFEGIFRAMSGKPVIIRLLDPPFHEFLPHEDQEMEAVARLIPGSSKAKVKQQILALQESNPMLGFRGCRLALVFPEIPEMQLNAILAAAKQVKSEGFVPMPQIEVPLVGHVQEFLPFKTMAQRVFDGSGVDYKIGSMIEVPRAALCANDLARECDFLSFGTNDLTQMTCGFSRDDAGRFLVDYVQRGIYKRDPFVSVDTEGVGKLMRIAVALARSVNAKMDIGICGEHGGEPASVEFCHRIGLSNVSCSPFRVPIARLAAAQARIKFGPRPKAYSVTSVFQGSNL